MSLDTPEVVVREILPPRGSVLAFDFGLARIGVAVGELETCHANPLTTLFEPTNAGRFAAIGALIQEWRPVGLVAGVPLGGDGETQALTARCRRFAHQLHGRFGLPVWEADERFSSVEAEARLVEAGRQRWRDRKAAVDAVAAQLILQAFLDSRCHAPA